MYEEQENSGQSKPRHVRKLEFGQAILRLNSVYNESAQDKDGHLIINDDTSLIPSMNRFEFVQKWIDTHKHYYSVERDDDPDCSKSRNDLICRTESSLTSPTLGKSKKKRDSVYSTRENLIDQSHTNFHSHFSLASSETGYRPLQVKDTNIQRIQTSVLDKAQNGRKRRGFSNQYSDMSKYISNQSFNINVQSQRNTSQVSIGEPPMKRVKQSVPEYDHFGITNTYESLTLESLNELNIEKSSSHDNAKDETFIEETSSGEARNNKCGSEQHSSMIIDDSDTQSHGLDAGPSRPYKQSLDRLETTDLDATYFSSADRVVAPVQKLLHSQAVSEHISSVTSATKQLTDSVNISTETSPIRTQSDHAVLLLESGKKRKKPKKGSLAERLQSLINIERSSIQIWRHRLKQSAEKNINNPYVTIYVQSCTSRFDKQLLEGIVVDDFAGLLPTVNTESNHREESNQRNISLLITPEMVGKIEMKSKCLVQIAPPWTLLDSEDLLLNVSCITIARFKSNIVESIVATKVQANKHACVEEFNCSCNLDVEKPAEYTLCSPCSERNNERSVLATLVNDS